MPEKKAKPTVVKADAEAGGVKQQQDQQMNDDDNAAEAFGFGFGKQVKIDELMDDAGAVSNSNVSIAASTMTLPDFEVESYVGGLWDKFAIIHYVHDHPWAVERAATSMNLLGNVVTQLSLFFPVMKPHELARIQYGDDLRNFWVLEQLTP